MAHKRHSDTFFDEKAAFNQALDYEFLDEVWVTPELKRFLTQRGVQYAVHAKMFLPSFLVATCNAMGMAKVNDGQKLKMWLSLIGFSAGNY